MQVEQDLHGLRAGARTLASALDDGGSSSTPYDSARHQDYGQSEPQSLPGLAVVTKVKLRARALRLKHLTLDGDAIATLSLAVEGPSSPGATAQEGQPLPESRGDDLNAGIITPSA